MLGGLSKTENSIMSVILGVAVCGFMILMVDVYRDERDARVARADREVSASTPEPSPRCLCAR